MITEIEEIHAIKAIMAETGKSSACGDISQAGRPVGIMLEIPAAVS